MIQILKRCKPPIRTIRESDGAVCGWHNLADLAKTVFVSVCPHILLELLVCLAGIIPNARWIECFPALTLNSSRRCA